MIHGVYVKSRPKGKWHLVSISLSPEMAAHDADIIIKQAEKEGNLQVKAAVQYFESSFHIPEVLSEIKEQKSMLN